MVQDIINSSHHCNNCENSLMDGSNSNFGMFNNNYMPGIVHYNRLSENHTQAPNSMSPYPGFTFAVPTQASIITRNAAQQFTQTLDSQCRLHGIAPGIGVNWQHTAPVQTTWTNNVSWSNPMGMSTCSTVPVMSSYVDSCEPKPSCSVLRKRPKRQATDNIDQVSAPTSKMFLTEEKMAAQMRELQISSLQQNTVVQPTPASIYRKSDLMTRINDAEERFQLIEARLEVDEDEENSDCHNKQPKLHFLESINGDSLIPSALPEKILEQLSKPRLEVVLWKPPGDFVKDFVSPLVLQKTFHSNDKCESSSRCTNTVSQSQSEDSQVLCQGEYCMDSEPYDDDMVL